MTITIKMTRDQATRLEKFLGQQFVASLPVESVVLIHGLSRSLHAIERHPDIHTINLSTLEE